MHIKEIKFTNMISNDSVVKISFNNKFYEEDENRFISNTIKDKKNSDYKEGLLNVVSIMGKNSSYKTSTLSSAYNIIDFIINFKSNANNLNINNISIKTVETWLNTVKGQSILDGDISYKDAIHEYLNTEVKKSEEKIMHDYIKSFFISYAFNKEKDIEFKVTYQDGFEELVVEGVIAPMINDKISFLFKQQGKVINLYENKHDKLINFNIDIASFELYNKNGFSHRGRDNIFFESAMSYLYFDYFKEDISKLTNLLVTLDQSVTSIKFKAVKDKQIFTVNSISREFGGSKENIDLADLSSGTQTFIVYLYFILKNDFVIIDELEGSLHLKLVSLLIEIARQKNKQLLFSTHSPLVVDKYIRNYELYINDVSDDKLSLIKGTSIYRNKDSYINKYLSDLVSNISDVDMDYLKMEFYD